MKLGKLTVFLVVVLSVVAVFGCCVSPLAASIKQGLDLQGGTRVLLEAVDTPQAHVNDEAVQSVIKILERRVNGMGLTEPVVQREGQRRIIVELPGVKDPDKAIETLGKTAVLEFKDESGATVLTGAELKNATAYTEPNHGDNVISLEFSDEGAKKFSDIMAKNVGKHIAILLDNKVLTNPVVNPSSLGSGDGKVIITGNRTLDEAQHVAVLLRSGALPVKVEVLEIRTVGPTLGQDSKNKSITAFTIGIAAVVLFMLLFYRLSGFVANIALLIYVLLLLAILRTLDATLTLPGIAGIILSIGMAVDANVLIFERLKEEYRAGKTLRAAVDAGFTKAFSTILDSHVTTLIAALVLAGLGTGTVKGFAVTLAYGTALSMFTAIVVTRFILKTLIRTDLFKNGKFFGA